MSNIMIELLRRARICPVACALKILLLLLMASALGIAVFFKNEMSIYTYVGFMVAIGYVAILAIATNGNCRLKLGEED